MEGMPTLYQTHSWHFAAVILCHCTNLGLLLFPLEQMTGMRPKEVKSFGQGHQASKLEDGEQNPTLPSTSVPVVPCYIRIYFLEGTSRKSWSLLRVASKCYPSEGHQPLELVILLLMV